MEKMETPLTTTLPPLAPGQVISYLHQTTEYVRMQELLATNERLVALLCEEEPGSVNEQN